MVQAQGLSERAFGSGRPSSPSSLQGVRVWALGIVLLGLVSLLLGSFDPGQPVPKGLPGRAFLACLADVFLLIAGAAVQWPHFRFPAAAALTAYYAVVVVIVLNGAVVLAHPTVFGSYSETAEQAALTAAGLIGCAVCSPGERHNFAPLVRIGQVTFGICALLFGGAHFVYMNLTAPLVPKWLPLSPVFWGEATGVAQIAAGLAIITGLQGRLASILLTIMYAAFTPLVHLPLLLGAPRTPFHWTENALNIALVGAAWVVADSWSQTSTRTGE